MAEVERLCSRVAVVKGRLLAVGTVPELRRQTGLVRDPRRGQCRRGGRGAGPIVPPCVWVAEGHVLRVTLAGGVERARRGGAARRRPGPHPRGPAGAARPRGRVPRADSRQRDGGHVSFRMHRALAVTWKEALDLRKNPGCWQACSRCPRCWCSCPPGGLGLAPPPGRGDLPLDGAVLRPDAAAERRPGALHGRQAGGRLVGIFLLMPVFVPILISSQSVAGEKERRTLEPLLAAPVSASELLLGKSLASVVPAVAITWTVLRRVRAWRWTPSPAAGARPGPAQRDVALRCRDRRAALRLPRRTGSRCSSRRASVRPASPQQLSALVVLPLIGLVGGQLAGWIRAGTGYYASAGRGGAGARRPARPGGRSAVRSRERLVSRWV